MCATSEALLAIRAAGLRIEDRDGQHHTIVLVEQIVAMQDELTCKINLFTGHRDHRPRRVCLIFLCSLG